MIKPIVTDVTFLSQVCEKATKDDYNIIQDLIDTAKEYESECCGLAAPQIGYHKKVCILKLNKSDKWTTLVNPIISKKSGELVKSSESCMSFKGSSYTVKRHLDITVMYTDHRSNKTKQLHLTGLNAIIAQHEIDHLQGVTILLGGLKK